MYQNSFWNDDNCAKEKSFVCEKSDKSQISIPEVVLPLSFNNGNLDPCPAGYSTFGGGFSLNFSFKFINLTFFFNIIVSTTDNTGVKSACNFPFKYNGSLYYECVTFERRNPWYFNA